MMIENIIPSPNQKRPDQSGLNGAFESYAESEFARVLGKYVNSDTVVQCQVPVADKFRLDFLVKTKSSYTAVFEIDGSKFHDSGEAMLRDKARDEEILEHIPHCLIFRIPASLVYYYPELTVHLLSLKLPDLLSERGKVNLQNFTNKIEGVEFSEYSSSIHVESFGFQQNEDDEDVRKNHVIRIRSNS